MNTQKNHYSATVHVRKILAHMLVLSMISVMMPVHTALAVSTWNPTLLVNTESFQQIDVGDGTTSVDLRFGASTSTLKLLSSGIFQFNKSLSVVGGISGSYLTIDRQANISGALLVKSTITSRSTVSGANLTFMGATNSYILGKVGIGMTTPKVQLEVAGTLSGKRLSLISDQAVSTGALYVRQQALATGALIKVDQAGRAVLALDSAGKTSASPHILFGYRGSFDTNLFRTSSAFLKTDGSFAAQQSLSGSSFFGAGLGDCNNSTTSKLIYNSTTGKFSCATDQTGGSSGGGGNWSNTGSLQTAFDSRYVNQSGDTMTGALTINITGGNFNTVGAKVINTLSGAHLHAEKLLSSSGTLRVLNTAIFSSGGVFDTNTLYVNANDNRVGIGTDAPTDVLTVHNATGNAFLHITNQSTGEGSTNGSSIGMNGFGLNIINHDVSFGGAIRFYNSDTLAMSVVSGKVGVNQTSPKAQFDVGGTISGSRLSISRNASITGSLVVRNSVSGSSLFSFGLGDCSNATTSKLIYNSTTGKFSCATDQTGGSSGGGGNWSNTGSLQSAFDRRFVNQHGDTMTGNLIIRSTSGSAVANLTVIGGMSGYFLRTSGNSSIHGALSASGTIRTDNDLTINDDAGAVDSVLTFGNSSGNQTLKFLNTAQKFQFSRGLSVIGILSGSQLAIDGNATISGSLLVKSTITSKSTVSGANLTFMGASSSYILGNLGIGKSGTPNTKLEVVGTISGAALFGYNINNSTSATSGSILVSRTSGKPEWKTPDGAMTWYLDGNIATGTNQSATVIMPFGMTLTDVDLVAKTAPVGSSLIVDINEGGTTLFSTRPEIDSAATREDGNHVFSDTTLAAGAAITIDIDQVGSSTAGNGLTIMLKGRRHY